jgi:L-lysine exporter family protein LysE/ArgO
VIAREGLAAFAAGFGLGGGLIVAIGAQNAFVLKHGLRRVHVLAVVTTCTLVDWALIALGAVGFGTLIARFPTVTTLAAWGGAFFLLWYGAVSFRSALRPDTLRAEEGSGGERSVALWPVVGATLAVSLLNPHVYLDTIVLLGSVAAQYATDLRVWFAVGAMVASFVWFFGLGLGARLLAPVFAKPSAWRVLDVLIGVVMWWIAAGLIVGQLR